MPKNSFKALMCLSAASTAMSMAFRLLIMFLDWGKKVKQSLHFENFYKYDIIELRKWNAAVKLLRVWTELKSQICDCLGKRSETAAQIQNWPTLNRKFLRWSGPLWWTMMKSGCIIRLLLHSSMRADTGCFPAQRKKDRSNHRPSDC